MITRTVGRVLVTGQQGCHKVRSAVVLVIGLAMCMSVRARADTLESWQSCCGATCLRTVAGLLGKQTDLARIRELLQPNNKGETSLAEITVTATKMGLSAVGVSIKSARLQECTVPLVAHKPPRHFVVLVGLGKGNGVLIIDPPHAPRKMTSEETVQQRFWNVVAISRQPLSIQDLKAQASPAGAAAEGKETRSFGGLRFDHTTWSFGSLKPGDKKAHEFPLVNVGRRPVVFHTVKAGCSCLKVSRFPQTIAPGEHEVIRVLMDAEGMHGYVGKTILGLVSRAGDNTRVEIRLSVFGEVSRRGELLVRPSQISLPDLVHGSKVNKVVTLRRIGYERLGFRRVRSTAPNVSVETVDGYEPDAYEAHAKIAISAENELGPFEHTVVFETDHPDCSTIAVDIRGNIIPHIFAEPATVFLGLLSGRSPQKRIVTIRSRTGTSFSIGDIRFTTNGLMATCQTMNQERTCWQVILTPSRIVQKGVLEGKAIIETDDPDRPLIEIPYTGLVAG